MSMRVCWHLKNHAIALRLIIGLLIAAITVPAWGADVDEAKLASFGRHGLLRWENIDGAPYWISGAPPEFESSSRLHVARLQPGRDLLVHLPAGSLLRVLGVRGALSPDDVRLWVSNGSGLYRASLSGVIRTDGSLLLAPDEMETSLVRIERPADQQGCVDVALFISRRLVPDQAFPYSCEWVKGGATVSLSSDGERIGDYRYLPPGTPARLQVASPARIRIESRLEYSAFEAENHQCYQLRVHGDAFAPHSLMIQTRHEGRSVIHANGTVRSLGEREVDYLDIPAGTQHLVVESTAGVFLRITAAPCHAAYPAGWLGDVDDALSGSIWNLTPQEVLTQLAAADYPASRRWRIAQRVGRDNRYRDGGLQAWNVLRQLSAQHPAHPELNRWADKAKSAFTRMQPLLPVTASGPLALTDAWFVVRALPAPTTVPYSPVVSSALVGDTVSSLAEGQFVEIPPAGYVVYALPDDRPDTQIRLALESGSLDRQSELSVQFDHSTPIQLRRIGDEALPNRLQQPSMAEAGLAVLNQQFGLSDAGTLGGPFAHFRHAAARVDVSTAALNVAHGTKSIRLTNQGQQSIKVCLHYRTSREVSLSESSFLANLQRQPDFSASVFAVLQGESPKPLVDQDAFEELRNHCEPFLRKLQLHHRALVAGVARPSEAELKSHSSSPPTDDQVQAAREMAQQQQWVAALEAWTRLVNQSEGPIRREAILQRVTALAALGESFLAETELRGRILYDPDISVRRAAQQQLADCYRRVGDTEALQRLASACLLMDPTGEQMARLAAASAENSDWSTSLLASLATPPALRSTEVLLQAAYQQGWWQIYERTLTQLDDDPQRKYWQALWCIRQGDVSTAVQLLAQAGPRGEAVRQHLVRSEQIVRGFRHLNVDQRIAAVRQWEEWSATCPGPYEWQQDDTVVMACQGAEYVVLEPVDDGYHYYRASATEPLKIRVAGPIDLQFEVRPLHSSSGALADEPLDDWLIVRGSGRELVWPITRNRAADLLRLRNDPDLRPGLKVRAQLRLGPGQHEFEVSAEAHDVLVRVAVRRPLCSLATLPPITSQTLDSILKGEWGQMVVDDVSCRANDECPLQVRVVNTRTRSTDVLSLPLVRTPLAGHAEQKPFSAVVSPWQRALLGLRDGSLTTQEANRLLASYGRSPISFRSDELIELAARAEVDPKALPAAANPQVVVDWQWMSVYRGQIEDALRVDPGSDETAQRTQAALLVRWAERQPTARAACAVRLADFSRQHPEDEFIASQLDRVREPGEWVLFQEVASSGGLYALPQAGPQALGRPAEIRQAFARPSTEGGVPADYLITGYRRLSLEFTEPRPLELEFDLRQPRISFLPAPQLQVELRVDDQPPQLFSLAQLDQLQRVKLSLSAGSHRVQLRITNPYAGHYVFLNVYEVTARGERLSWKQQGGKAETELLYHVATQSTPVQLHLHGPAWIRVERVIDGQRETGETTIAEGDRQVTLAAPEGVKHALYRVWEYRFASARSQPPVFAAQVDHPPATRRWLDDGSSRPILGDLGRLSQVMPASHYSPMDDPELTGLASADATASSVDLFDTFPLGGFGDGTWGFGMGAVQRRALEEGPQLSGEDRFLPLTLSYEHFSPDSNTYTNTQSIFRIRESSGPTFGVVHELWTPLENMIEPFCATAECDDSGDTGWLNHIQTHNLFSAYVQQPSDPLPFYDGRTEASLGMRSRIYSQYHLTERWYHLPSWTFIGRWLSLDQTSYQPSRIDQDIFTPFKNDQRAAFYLTDTWIFEPTEFGRVWLRPTVYTNEDLNPFRPDHVALHTGLAGLWCNVDWEVSYRLARFFQDADRRDPRTQNLLYWDAVLDHWQHSGSRFELSLNVRYDCDDGDTSTFLTLTRFLSRGRGYADHHPSEVGFRALRERRAYPTWQFHEGLGP